MKIVAESVDVVAKFIAKEKPVPAKLRCEGKEIKVDQVFEIEEIREVGFRTYLYHCQGRISGAERRFEWENTDGTEKSFPALSKVR